MRVTSLAGLASEWEPGLAWLVPVASRQELQSLERLVRAGIDSLYPLVDSHAQAVDAQLPTVIADRRALEVDDVVALTPQLAQLQVLYRASDQHHTVFLTNRCNSYCLMCSQPPTRHDDGWLVDEALAVAAHIRPSPAAVGFSGGEPLLLGARLREVLEGFCQRHPATRLEVLSNGRLLCDRALATQVLTGLPPRTWWMVPLYGHADFLHDFVVQSPGAFDQTVDGLLTLHAYRQPIQLRVVLIEPTLRILQELCAFIARNLPFVRQVALMGCEPTGFALANRELCEVNIRNWHDSLVRAVRHLACAGIPTALMNLPRCTLPDSLRGYAHRSISDWKQRYAIECTGCQLRGQCCGMFMSHERGWRPGPLRALTEASGP